MEFINLTPHPVNLPKGTIPTSGEVARVETTHKVQSTVDYIPESWIPGADGPQPVPVEIMDTTWGRVLHLPEFRHGKYLIVSSQVVVAAYLAGRRIDDLLVPGAQKRGGQGQIVGAGGLTTGRSCIPGAFLELRPPQIAVFGSAAAWARLSEHDKARSRVVGDEHKLPRDIDAVYAGIDQDEAATLVRRWATAAGLSDSIPLDLHHSPSMLGFTTPGLVIPRPKPLPGEDGTVPPDTAWVRVLGDAPVKFSDAWTLAAMFRRLDRIMECNGGAYTMLPDIVRAVFEERPNGGSRTFSLSLDLDPTMRDDYAEGTLGAARRAFARLGPVRLWLLDQLRDLPVTAGLRIVLDPEWTPSPEVMQRAIAGTGNGSPSKAREIGVLYVSRSGIRPGYSTKPFDPTWLTGGPVL